MMTPKIRSLIVDDEASSRENLSILLNDFCPAVEVVGLAVDLEDAEAQLQEKAPQLVFFDIQIGPDTVFSLLTKLNKVDFEIVFTTAHEHYAVRAFKFMAVDYLMKPVKIEELVVAVNNAVERISAKSLHLSIDEMMLHVQNFNRTKHKVALSTAKGYEMVYIHEIMYCLANGSYTMFVFQDATSLVVSRNLKYYENLLVEYDFVRCHNTALVNLHFVKTLERAGSIVMEDGAKLPISKTRRQEMDARIKEKRRLI